MNLPPNPPRKPIQCATFHASSTFGPTRDPGMLKEAQDNALAWMNSSPEVEIVSITSCMTDRIATVTVWHRA